MPKVSLRCQRYTALGGLILLGLLSWKLDFSGHEMELNQLVECGVCGQIDNIHQLLLPDLPVKSLQESDSLFKGALMTLAAVAQSLLCCVSLKYVSCDTLEEPTSSTTPPQIFTIQLFTEKRYQR